MSRLLALVACVPLMGCGMILEIDGLVADRVPGGGGSGGGGAGGGGGDCLDVCGTPGCGECPNTPLVAVPQTERPYQIDAYEVTNAQYQAFLDAGVATSLQDQQLCGYNTSFVPGTISQQTLDELQAAGADLAEVMNGVMECENWLQRELDDFGSERPVACVDVCDARAYCTWAGKRLCGEVAGEVLNVTMGVSEGVHINPDRSEWYRACSNAGANIYPYGMAYETGRCIDAGLSPNTTYEVGYRETCEGGYPGIFDMSGNVGEWENACTFYSGSPAPVQNCLVRGGAYYNGFMGDDPLTLSCTFFRDTLQSGPSASIGFRCCSD